MIRCPRCFGKSIRTHVHTSFGDLGSTDGQLMQCRACGWDGFEERFEDNTPLGAMAISNLVWREDVSVIQIQPVIDYSMRALCSKPYPLHPKGCPNLYKSKRCPPIVPHFDKMFDMTQPIFAVVNEFDFGAHVDRMRIKHPNWSDRQLRCVLYWQSTARKNLKAKVLEALREMPGYTVTMSPEGQGVNVTETMKNVGVILEWPPQKIARQIAFLAKLKGTTI